MTDTTKAADTPQVQMVDPSLRAGKVWIWLGAVEDNGMASASRVHMIYWSAVCSLIFACVFWHMFHLSDTSRLQIWLASLPVITICLTALMQSGYLINQTGGAFGVLA